MNPLKILFMVSLISSLLSPTPQTTAADIQTPVLKWKNAGCYSSWCETGWYSSPAALDLDQDGDVEVIAGTYSLFLIEGSSGTLIKRIDPDASRNWPSIVAADIDNNGDLEVVSAHGDGSVHVFDHNMNPVWSRQPTPGKELRSLAVYDLDNNGDLEIIVASTRAEDQWFVYEHNGDLRSGDWPQHSPDSDTNGYTAGCFNQNIAAGDMNGDGLAEIIGSNDTHYLAAFLPDGSQLPASTIYGTLPGGLAKPWSLVGRACRPRRGFAWLGLLRHGTPPKFCPLPAHFERPGWQRDIGSCYRGQRLQLRHIPLHQLIRDAVYPQPGPHPLVEWRL